jgi:hypothetical protein
MGLLAEAITGYERTPDLGRPERTFGRGLHKHEAVDHKRGRSPMQGILEVNYI